MEAKVLNNKFKLFLENANRVLIAFCTQENYNNQAIEKIKSVIYDKFVANGHLASTDAEIVYQYVYNKTNLKIEVSSLVLIEFDKGDSIIENTYGQDIITMYEKGGKELRIFYPNTNKLALCINLKTPKTLKNLFCVTIGFLAIVFLYFALTHWLSIEKVKQECNDYAVILKDSLNQAKTEISNLAADNENLKTSNNNLNKELSEIQEESEDKQHQIDSLSRILSEHEMVNELNIHHQTEDRNSNENHKVVPERKKPTVRKSSSTSYQNEKLFEQKVDRGDKFASSYMKTRAESDKRNAISCYRDALNIKADSEVINKLNKLLKK